MHWRYKHTHYWPSVCVSKLGMSFIFHIIDSLSKFLIHPYCFLCEVKPVRPVRVLEFLFAVWNKIFDCLLDSFILSWSLNSPKPLNKYNKALPKLWWQATVTSYYTKVCFFSVEEGRNQIWRKLYAWIRAVTWFIILTVINLDVSKVNLNLINLTFFSATFKNGKTGLLLIFAY